MSRHISQRIGLFVLAPLVVATGACSAAGPSETTPGLTARGTTLTTAKPTRQDLSNTVSLAGTVTAGPVFGIVAPVSGEVRYLSVSTSRSTPTKPTRVATVWAGGKPTNVEVPANAVFAGRLVDDRATVPAGMPIVSAHLRGYGIVADIGGEQAYRISESPGTVQAQIKNGPGPFACTPVGTIAALPAGTIPDPPPAAQPSQPAGRPGAVPTGGPGNGSGDGQSSAQTGIRLVCTAPGDVKLISGAAVTLTVVTEKSANALVLPVEAVAGTQGRGKVDVVKPDQTRETRDVVLGLTDGKVVEIRSGLTGDETVAVPGPNLPAAKTATDGVPGATKGP